MAPFETSLDTLKRFFTAWGKYRTLVSLTVYPSCRFMFAEPFSSHFIFRPFPTVTLISHFLTSVVSFLLYGLCDDTLLSPNHYLWYYYLLSSWYYPNIWFPQRGCLFHCLSLCLSLPNSQPPWVLFFQSFCIIHWSGVSYHCFCFLWNFLYCCFPNNMTLFCHICRTFCIFLLRTFRSCCSVYFLRRLMLEPSLLVQLSIVFYLCSTLYSRTNIPLSWGP